MFKSIFKYTIPIGRNILRSTLNLRHSEKKKPQDTFFNNNLIYLHLRVKIYACNTIWDLSETHTDFNYLHAKIYTLN